MDTPEEIARDEWYTELVEEISTEAVDQFTFECLSSYYLANRNLATNVLATYNEATEIIELSPSAALVLFTAAIEVALKVTLLKPIVYGLVHNEAVAELVSDLAVKHNGFDRFKPLLSKVLNEYGDIDFDNYKIENHSKTIWEEISILQKARNNIVHRSELTDGEMATLSKEVATMVIGDFLNSVLYKFGLELKKGGVIDYA